MSDKKPIDFLKEAAIAISYCDTNGNLLKKSINDREELATLNEICRNHPAHLNEVQKMFQAIGAYDEESQEIFLSSLGASLRMFPEQNDARSGNNHIARHELAELVHHMDAARASSNIGLYEFSKYLNMFLDTRDMSLAFAKSQKFQTFAEMAELIHAPKILNNTLENGWENYAEMLPLFNTYWHSLEPQQKQMLAGTLFHLAAKQEGVKLTLANPEIQDIFAKAKEARHTTEVSAQRNSIFRQGQTSPQPTRSETPAPDKKLR